MGGNGLFLVTKKLQRHLIFHALLSYTRQLFSIIYNYSQALIYTVNKTNYVLMKKSLYNLQCYRNIEMYTPYQSLIAQLVNFKMKSRFENNLEGRYSIKFSFKLGESATETDRMVHTTYGLSCKNRASGVEWHMRYYGGGESIRVDESCLAK